MRRRLKGMGWLRAVRWACDPADGGGRRAPEFRQWAAPAAVNWAWKVFMATKKTKTAESEETQRDAPEGPVIDSMGGTIKKMVARGKERGYIT